MYAILVLVVSISLYAYCMPYKSKTANILEVVVQLNLLILLLLELPSIVRDNLFIFSGDMSDAMCGVFSNISYIVILLAPIYYIPVLVLIVVAILQFIKFVRYCCIAFKVNLMSPMIALASLDT